MLGVGSGVLAVPVIVVISVVVDMSFVSSKALDVNCRCRVLQVVSSHDDRPEEFLFSSLAGLEEIGRRMNPVVQPLALPPFSDEPDC